MDASPLVRDEGFLLGQWARLLLGTLCAAGVTDIFISPGSRSTPFTWAALSTQGLRCHAVIDERAAGFAAIGHARFTARPAALLCTSGSAAAHYLPALVEAALSFLPVIVITADRPFESQHAGAAQTIDQCKLYGDHVRCFFELGLPDPTQSALVGLRRIIGQAVAMSLAPAPGPVHLNARARKPLESRAAQTEEDRVLRAKVDGLLAARLTAYPRTEPRISQEAIKEIARALVSASAGAIVIGPLSARSKVLTGVLGRIAGTLSFPILAEASSQLRFSTSSHDMACPGFTWLLGLESFRRSHRPDVVLCLGAPPTCSGFEAWMSGSGALRFVLCENGFQDPLGSSQMVAGGDLLLILELLEDEISSMRHEASNAQRDFAHALVRGSRVCQGLVRTEVLNEPVLAEGGAVACLLGALPDGAQLVLGNSLPIRDVDAYVFYCSDVAVYTQRGANGIDGLVSGAAGTAMASASPTLLLIGEVSLQHDLGGLAVARLVRTPLVIAVLDNGGGRIFDQLPVQKLYDGNPEFARFWLTPDECDLAHAARSFGLGYTKVATESELLKATTEALRVDSATLLQVKIGPESARTVRERALANLSLIYRESVS
jgi:2-succinyl-5-enolpyruvyl-6-hydroxy-3-cyclohexene-1-carboxylate synthase